MANTHLFFNPKTPWVKTLQMSHLLGRLEAVLALEDAALVLCGDHNETPRSYTYSLLTEGKVRPGCLSRGCGVSGGGGGGGQVQFKVPGRLQVGTLFFF